MKIKVYGKKEILNGLNKILIGGLVIVLIVLIIPLIKNQQVIQSVSKAKKMLPIYSVKTEKKQVAISFDAAWGCENTEELLRILDQHKVKTTFFLVGSWVDKHPDMVKKIREAGHDIGNHSNRHPDMTKMEREQIKGELMTAHEKVKNVADYEMNLFRAPFGAYDDQVMEVAKACNYYVIQWSIDSDYAEWNVFI